MTLTMAAPARAISKKPCWQQLVTGARLGDRLGHGHAFLGGLGAFTLASLLCGLAPATGPLIGFRLLQGPAPP